MSTKITRIGRPSNAEVIRREAQARRSAMNHLIRALQHLNHPSRLSESPLCQLDGVKRQAAMLRGYRYPRAHIVIQAVRQAYDLAWAELGGTKDACCLIALADALEGVSREDTAHKTGVSLAEISRRRREAVDIIIDHVLALLQGEQSRS